MHINWRDLPESSLEAIYNPRVATPNAAAELSVRSEVSQRAHASLQGRCQIDEDIRYGPGPLQTLDLYRPFAGSRDRALVAYVHGGYWRALDKRDSASMAPPLIETGAVVANINYDLCPQITLDAMVEQIVDAVRFCHAHASDWGADPARLILMGHSAGAHLAASALCHARDDAGLPADLLAAVVAISGIYEPEVVLHLSVNEQVQLDAAMAARHNCLERVPQRAIPVVISVGGDEPQGWIDQSLHYAEVVQNAGCQCTAHVLEGTNHFTVGDASFRDGTPTFAEIRHLITGE